MQAILAVDLGGTKVAVQIADLTGHCHFEKRYYSGSYSDFHAVLRHLFNDIKTLGVTLISSCFAVAGPVIGMKAKLTNLPWLIDGVQLSQDFPLGKLYLCNDFVATAYGISAIHPDKLQVIHAVKASQTAPAVVIGAGTGLGQAVIMPSQQILATEGGNVDFAPRDAQQLALLQYAMTLMSHVSYERLLSGAGIELIYQFMLCRNKGSDNSVPGYGPLSAATISQLAQLGDNQCAIDTLRLFVRIYGAQAGNLALTTLARGGVYIAGGIAVKNSQFILSQDFIDAFLAKGKMAKLMTEIPVTLIMENDIGVIGARQLAIKRIDE